MNKGALIGGAVIIIMIAALVWVALVQKVSAPTDTTNPPAGQTTDTPYTPPQTDTPASVDQEVVAASRAARADLAAKLGVSAPSITVVRAEARTWSDGCLGLGGPAESCLAALVEGYRIELQAQGKAYAYRTDQTGSSVRQEP